MHHDSFFMKGQRHLVCQDYARCDAAFGVIADGCSSVADTDLGARLLVLAALAHKHNFLALPDHFYKSVVQDCVKHADMLKVFYTVLHATLGVVVPTQDTFEAMLCGDGYIVARRRDMTGLKIVEVDYANMPYYPLYSVLGEDSKDMVDPDDFLPSIKTITVPLMGVPTVEVKKSDFQKFFRFSFPKEEYDLVAVTTDGLGKMVQLNEEGKPIRNLSEVEVAVEIFQKAKQDEQKRFFGVQALEEGLNRLVDIYDQVALMDDFGFALFLDV